MINIDIYRSLLIRIPGNPGSESWSFTGVMPNVVCFAMIRWLR